jgi:hypothetical protein
MSNQKTQSTPLVVTPSSNSGSITVTPEIWAKMPWTLLHFLRFQKHKTKKKDNPRPSPQRTHHRHRLQRFIPWILQQICLQRLQSTLEPLTKKS